MYFIKKKIKKKQKKKINKKKKLINSQNNSLYFIPSAFIWNKIYTYSLELSSNEYFIFY